MGEVLTLLKGDIEAAGSQTIRDIFGVYFQEFPPIVETELLQMLAKRSHYAREWSLFCRITLWFCPRSCRNPSLNRTVTQKVRKACTKFWDAPSILMR